MAAPKSVKGRNARDPDNMAYPFPELSFVHNATKARVKAVKVEPVTLAWAPDACCFVAHGVLDSREANEIATRCTEEGFSLAMMPKPHRRQAYQPDLRDSFRWLCWFDSVSLAQYFEALLGRWLPQEVDGARFMGVNERCR